MINNNHLCKYDVLVCVVLYFKVDKKYMFRKEIN